MSRIIYACGCGSEIQKFPATVVCADTVYSACICGDGHLWASPDVGAICPECNQPVTAYDLDALLRAKRERDEYKQQG